MNRRGPFGARSRFHEVGQGGVEVTGQPGTETEINIGPLGGAGDHFINPGKSGTGSIRISSGKSVAILSRYMGRPCWLGMALRT